MFVFPTSMASSIVPLTLSRTRPESTAEKTMRELLRAYGTAAYRLLLTC